MRYALAMSPENEKPGPGAIQVDVNRVEARDDDAHAEPFRHRGDSAGGFTAIGPYFGERQLREAALVLSSMSIPHHAHRSSVGGMLLVHDSDYARAREHLDRYEEENKNFPPPRAVERPRYGGWPFVAAAFVALVLFAIVTGPVAHPSGAWFQRGASVASKVLGPEPLRAVTALTLHADGAHVLGNLLSGAVFGRGVERRLGPGGAGLGILVSGAVGNAANAAFHVMRGQEHASIGASTAVFGAVGMLAASQLLMGSTRVETPEGGRHWTHYAAPFVGGLALLGALGASPESDVWAHGFGFLAGLVVAIPFALVARKRRATNPFGQALMGLAAIGTVVGSWVVAMR
jgi:membrane associated rhomboid family serine protease